MRKKLKLARELLEDLLVERDEMEQIQVALPNRKP